MTDLLEAALTLARALPPSSPITITAGTLLEGMARQGSNEGATQLLSTGDLAARYRVAESTARGWLAGGLAPGAFRLARLGWRVPATALPALEASLRTHDPDRLADWRLPQPSKRGR